MTNTYLKEQLHQYIEDADERLLHIVHGIFKADGERKDWWDEISEEQRLAIDEGLAQLDRGEGIPHEKVMKEVGEKYKLA